MIKRVARPEAEIVPLPGRTWHPYLGPHNSAIELLCLFSPPAVSGSYEKGRS